MLDMTTQQQLWKKKLRGWQLIADAEKSLVKPTTLASDMSALFIAARAIPIHPSEQKDLRTVRNRWIKIKRGKNKE
jgi:hypothetical protein